MKQSSLTRQLIAGAAGLLIGASSALALVSPAQATGGHEPTYGEPTALVLIKDDCDGTNIKIKAGGTNRGWRIIADGVTVEGSEHPSSLWLGPDDTHKTSIPADQATGVTVEWWRSKDGSWATTHGSQDQLVTIYPKKGPGPHDWKKPKKCPDDDPEEQVDPDVDILPLIGCDFLVFAVRNNTEGAAVSMEMTPNQDVVHGHAPGFVPLLDAEPDEDGFFETPEDSDLDVLGELGSGESFTVGPLAEGQAHAHGFESAEGLAVQVVVTVDGEVLFDENVDWAEDGLDCAEEEEDEGEGGELPVTGSSTLLIAGGALALLALGGGMFMIARRRRVTFTA